MPAELPLVLYKLGNYLLFDNFVRWNGAMHAASDELGPRDTVVEPRIGP